jgi:hypothetical protein
VRRGWQGLISLLHLPALTMKRRACIWSLSALIALGAFGGCNMLKHDPALADDEHQGTWGKLFSHSAEKRDSFFFNEKSWEIEEHLNHLQPPSSL